ncbi:hypothetical protein GWI33_002393 [Rhynchophorus ferrugineus]|uniref:Uncharacterized protein n=1 Tax=Rhynchophorus ferrugineus TaxID=354439 RepID=A0A834IMH6_RHYFE|nr:hypothetical protein GWI33_002393 [Rhynchophorus ferrugineus]
MRPIKNKEAKKKKKCRGKYLGKKSMFSLGISTLIFWELIRLFLGRKGCRRVHVSNARVKRKRKKGNKTERPKLHRSGRYNLFGHQNFFICSYRQMCATKNCALLRFPRMDTQRRAPVKKQTNGITGSREKKHKYADHDGSQARKATESVE